MPIYEYRCPDCGRRVSVFFRTFSAAQSGGAAAACPHCGGTHLERLVSKVSFIRSGADDAAADAAGDSFDGGEGGGDFGGAGDFGSPGGDMYGGGGDMYGGGGDPGGMDDMMAGIDEDDPRSIARWARQMQQQTGEDLGPGFDTALSRIEAGEDPDKVMDDMEPELGGDDAGGGMDDDLGGDFD